MHSRILGILLAIVGAGCTSTLPVRGSIDETNEVFRGTATGHMDGAGSIKLESNTGPTCTGSFVYVTKREGSGVLQCSDGRGGPFRFVSTGSRGTGSGTLGGKSIIFTFGGM